MTRQEIKQAINLTESQIHSLEDEMYRLKIDYLTTSDEEHWYEEKMEKQKIYEGKKYEYIEIMIGRVHWYEWFKDEDTGQKIKVERSRAIRGNGAWYKTVILDWVI